MFFHNARHPQELQISKGIYNVRILVFREVIKLRRTGLCLPPVFICSGCYQMELTNIFNNEKLSDLKLLLVDDETIIPEKTKKRKKTKQDAKEHQNGYVKIDQIEFVSFLSPEISHSYDFSAPLYVSKLLLAKESLRFRAMFLNWKEGEKKEVYYSYY